MAWLSGWSKRIRMIIDHTYVGSYIDTFPVTVILNTSNGNSVFDELTLDTQKAKVQFTMGDGITCLYAECDSFDVTNRKAVYHISKAGWIFSSTTDTIFYMYFDSTQDDNSTYIGTSKQDTATLAVWQPEDLSGSYYGGDYRDVLHVGQSPLIDSLDSTMTGGSSLPYLASIVDSYLYKGVQFGGTGGYGYRLTPTSEGDANYTSIFFKYIANSDRQCMVQFGESSTYSMSLEIDSSGQLYATYNGNDYSSSITDTVALVDGTWNHAAVLYRPNANIMYLWRNGIYVNQTGVDPRTNTSTLIHLGEFNPSSGLVHSYPFAGIIDEVRVRQPNYYYLPDTLTSWSILEWANLQGYLVGFDELEEFEDYVDVNPYVNDYTSEDLSCYGKLPCFDNSSLNTNEFIKFTKILDECDAGTLLNYPVASTISLIYSTGGYRGGTLDVNGNIHLIPVGAEVGQKLSKNNIVSTYSLIYTNANAYFGGVLSPNGDVHFIPSGAQVGQKINSLGVVSTYSLLYTTSDAYRGGVLSSSGEVHFIPYNANVGQKVKSDGTVTTYSLIYTTTGAYCGGVLSQNGYIYLVPYNAPVGQKISPSGIVSTYNLIYTGSGSYSGGVLDSEGWIHFVPNEAVVGQKVSSFGYVNTYSLIYTTTSAYTGGVFSSDGFIYFIPMSASVGQRVKANGSIHTFNLYYTSPGSFGGGILRPDGTICMIPYNGDRFQILYINPVKTFGFGICCCPFYNKF